jgi:hypothetical protein
MKTFKEFIVESKTTKRLMMRAAELIKNNSEKSDVYKGIIKHAMNRLKGNDSIDYPGRTSARKDKHLIPYPMIRKPK